MKTYLICAAMLAHASHPGWAHQPTQTSEDTCNLVATYAEASGLPVELAVGVAYHESKLRTHAKNPTSSAYGPMQILSGWCKHGDDGCRTVESTMQASMVALWWHMNRWFVRWDWRKTAHSYVGVVVAIDKDRAAHHAAKIYTTALWLESQEQCQCSRGM